MKIISITNQKGGVGKTTIAYNLCAKFTSDGYKSLLVDADTQKSAMTFREIRSENENLPQFSCIENTSRTLHKDIKSMKNSFDFIFIDSGGRDSPAFRSAFLCSDLIIVPVTPGSLELWGTEQTFDIIENAREYNENVKLYVLQNMVKLHTKIEKDLFTTLTEMSNDYKFNIFKTILYDRVNYRYATSEGKAIFEFKGSNDKAVIEFESFIKELKGAI